MLSGGLYLSLFVVKVRPLFLSPCIVMVRVAGWSLSLSLSLLLIVKVRVAGWWSLSFSPSFYRQDKGGWVVVALYLLLSLR